MMRDNTATMQQVMTSARERKPLFKFISEYKGEIPGATRSECGETVNKHNFEGRAAVIDMVGGSKGLNEEKLD